MVAVMVVMAECRRKNTGKGEVGAGFRGNGRRVEVQLFC